MRILPLVALCSTLLAACKQSGEESRAHADQHTAWLSDLIDKDVAEVRSGLPETANRLSSLVFKGADPSKDLPLVQRSLARARREVSDMNRAKSTFLGLFDKSGIGIRNDLEEDRMAGMPLFDHFPALAETGNTKDCVETIGVFPGPLPKPDKDWVSACPVRTEDKTVKALVVTGWSYRYFARHLYEALKSELLSQARNTNTERKIPIFYVGLFDEAAVYAAPMTPDVNEETLRKEGLSARTEASPFSGVRVITDRTFGFSARRTPILGPRVGVWVLRSEF